MLLWIHIHNHYNRMSRALFVGVFVSAALLMPVFAAAAEFRAGDQPSLASNERTAGNFYIAGGNVTSGGQVRGDLAAAGGNVLVSGPVSEDIAAAGGSITILGNAGGDMRVAGGNIIVNGQVGGDLAVAGGQVQVSGAGVGGDVLWGGGVLRIDAPVAGNLELAGGNVFINAPVRGNVHFTGEKLTLGSNAVIDGNLTYSSPKEAEVLNGAVVKGTTSYEPRPSVRAFTKTGVLAVLSSLFLLKFIMLFASALVLGLVFKRYSATLVHTVVSQPLLELGRGFVMFAALPAASVVLLMTVIGVPLGALGLIVFGALILFASIASPIVLGSIVRRWISKSTEHDIRWTTILLGAALFTLLNAIPFVGWIAKFVILLMTAGAVTKIKWGIIQDWR